MPPGTAAARGRFITLEGIDGAGKSTHVDWIAETLRVAQHAVRVTREPGGTVLGERIREVLLDPAQEVDREAETLLMFAARRQHLAAVIAPALDAGEWVLCDRFTDATYAYQGGGRGVDRRKIEVLEEWVQGVLQPDLTFYFDVPPEVARQRLQGARAPDRFEQERAEFFERVRAAYLERARRFPARIVVLDGREPPEAVRQQLAAQLAKLAQ